MPILKRGTFEINLGIVKLSAELSEEDRQCAWELYTELSTRVAITGKVDDDECKNFDGELYIESMASLYNFFKESRTIMKKFPVGKIGVSDESHLGVIINRVMANILRPFLEKWQVEYRYWWDGSSDAGLPPMERQLKFPRHDEFISDWAALRWLMRKLQEELVSTYQLTDVTVE